MLAHTCNPSSLEGWGRRISSSSVACITKQDLVSKSRGEIQLSAKVLGYIRSIAKQNKTKKHNNFPLVRMLFILSSPHSLPPTHYIIRMRHKWTVKELLTSIFQELKQVRQTWRAIIVNTVSHRTFNSGIVFMSSRDSRGSFGNLFYVKTTEIL